MFNIKTNFIINILYVEDEEVIRETIGNTLKTFFTCTLARDGKEALDLYRDKSNKFDLILTDINMPILNGIELVEIIRKEDEDIPIIITTAHFEQDFLLKAINLGVNQYVLKPLNVITLIKTISKVIEPILIKNESARIEKKYQRKLLEQAKFSAIGELVAGITHEINTPLTFMKSSLELIDLEVDDLADSKGKASIKDDLKILESGFIRIENIIKSMKEITSSDKILKENINLYDSLVVALNLAHNKSKHISKVFINDKEFIFNGTNERVEFIAKVNKSKIEQLWIILINNALDELVKIEDYDLRKLSIDISYVDTNHLKIIFKDNAGGIKEEILDNLFEPFQSTKKSFGMGIGLSIAKKIVKAHGGEIKAYNKDGNTFFEIILPIEI